MSCIKLSDHCVQKTWETTVEAILNRDFPRIWSEQEVSQITTVVMRMIASMRGREELDQDPIAEKAQKCTYNKIEILIQSVSKIVWNCFYDQKIDTSPLTPKESLKAYAVEKFKSQVYYQNLFLLKGVLQTLSVTTNSPCLSGRVVQQIIIKAREDWKTMALKAKQESVIICRTCWANNTLEADGNMRLRLYKDAQGNTFAACRHNCVKL